MFFKKEAAVAVAYNALTVFVALASIIVVVSENLPRDDEYSAVDDIFTYYNNTREQELLHNPYEDTDVPISFQAPSF